MKKFIIGFILIYIITGYSLAFNVSLTTNKKIEDINNPIELTIDIENDKNESAEIIKIKGLENFDIIGQNQFQSMSSKISIINGKQESKTILHQKLILILQAKKEGLYTIGPAVIKVGGKVYTSNSIKVKITGTKIMIGNSNYNLSQSIQSQNNSSQKLVNNSSNNKNQNIEYIENNTSGINPIVIILVLLALIGLGIIIHLVKTSKNKQEQIIHLENEKDQKSYKPESKLSFLTKYGIQNPETKTYSEIMKEIEQKNVHLTYEEKEIIENLLIDKFKN